MVRIGITLALLALVINSDMFAAKASVQQNKAKNGTSECVIGKHSFAGEEIEKFTQGSYTALSGKVAHAKTKEWHIDFDNGTSAKMDQQFIYKANSDAAAKVVELRDYKHNKKTGLLSFDIFDGTKTINNVSPATLFHC